MASSFLSWIEKHRQGFRIIAFSVKSYDKDHLKPAFLEKEIEPFFTEATLNSETLALAEGYDAICIFVNDSLDAESIKFLHSKGLKYILLRCAGYNNVDIEACKENGVKVARVPAYSPHSIAEFAVGQMLMLNRRLNKAYNRTREGNFNLEGLTGFDIYGKTVGIIGTGKIGQCTAALMKGFGTKVIAFDLYPNKEAAKNIGFEYKDCVEDIYKEADIISLHCPLSKETNYMISFESIDLMKDGVMIINTSRGELIDTKALIKGLKKRKIGAVALDVYEYEKALFFKDSSHTFIQDDVITRLLTFPNVSVTGHQAFLTTEALTNIATTTVDNCLKLLKNEPCANLVE